LKQLLESRTCFECGSDKTYVRKEGWESWCHDKERNIICNNCYCKQYGKQYRLENRDNELLRVNLYHALNHEEKLTRDAIYRALHQPQIIAYRQSHKERQKEHYNIWCVKNRFRRVEYQRRYNASRTVI
jgi:hypothetical protein